MSTEPVTHTEWLGRIVLAASGIELHARGIAAELVDPVEPKIGPIVIGRLGNSYANLVPFALKLAPLRLTEASPAHDLLDPITSWLKETTDFMEQRNACLHAVWMINGDHPEATRLSLRSMEYREVSVRELAEIADRGAELYSTGGDLWEQLIYRYGHLDALIEETERMEREGFDAVFREGRGPGRFQRVNPLRGLPRGSLGVRIGEVDPARGFRVTCRINAAGVQQPFRPRHEGASHDAAGVARSGVGARRAPTDGLGARSRTAGRTGAAGR